MTPEEQLEAFLEPFGVEKPSNIIVKGKKVFEAPPRVRETAEMAKAEFISLGLPMGEVTKKGFMPSFALLDMIAGSPNAVVINQEAEWLFLCGRDVFARNVVSDENTAQMFLVKNQRGEVLGLGAWGRAKKHVKPVLDRGDFLRREQ